MIQDQHPLYRSKEWYTFVSEHAAKDPQVLALVASYMDAMTKLNQRLMELASTHPELSLQIRRTSAGDVVTGGLMKPIKAYHDYHGIPVTEESLNENARSSRFDIHEVL